MTEVHETPGGVTFVRTPDERFADLPDWPYEARSVDVDGLRMAYVDEGPEDGRTILLLHGEPTWGYLYRRMVPPLLAAGYRCVVPDLVGFGRSDKPTEREAYTYAGHVAWLASFVEQLDLGDVIAFVQDWGGLLGLRRGRRAPRPIRPARHRQHRSPRRRPDGRRVHGLAGRQPDDDDGCRCAAAAGHPGPHADGRRGRRLPGAVPRRAVTWPAPASSRCSCRPGPTILPSRPTGRRGRCSSGGPTPCSPSGRRTTSCSGATRTKFLRRIPGTADQPHQTFSPAGHFIQDDVGEQLAAAVAMIGWLR